MGRWLTERVHVYWFVVLFSAGTILGIAGSVFVDELNFSRYIFVLLAAAFLAASLVKLRRIFLIFILVSGILLGLWRGSLQQVGTSEYQKYYDSNVTLSGVVVDDVGFGPDGNPKYKLRDISIDNTPMSGEVWVSGRNAGMEIKRSDTVTAKGFLSEGFGSFSASLVRAEIINIELTSERDIGLQARDTFAAATEGNIPEPERSLGLGYLLGLKSALPESLALQIQILGLTHVVVASGYNLTILVSFARRLFVNISKYLSTLVGGGMIVGFILITGFSPSMSRAGLVAGLSLLAWYYGRKFHPLTLLLITASITLLIHPAYIWGDIGWYLSFTAFFGVLILAPLIHHYFWGGDKRPSLIRDLVVATLSAQILTLPIILYSFGTFSIYSLPANLLILPIVPLCMLATFIAGLGGLFLPFIAGIISLPAVWLLKYCTFVIEKVSAMPHVQNEIQITLPQVFIGYGLIVILTILLFVKTKHNFMKDKIIVD